MTDNASMFRTYVGIDYGRFDYLTDCLINNLAAIEWKADDISICDIGAFDGRLTQVALEKLISSGRASSIRNLTLVEPDLDIHISAEIFSGLDSITVCRHGFGSLARRLPPNSFDLICLFHCLYHCSDFAALADELNAFIAQNGIIYAVLDDTSAPFYAFLREAKAICSEEVSEYGGLIELEQFLHNYSRTQITLRHSHWRNVRIHSAAELLAMSVFVGRFDKNEMKSKMDSVLRLFESHFGTLPVDLKWREHAAIVQPKKERCNV